MFDVHGVDSSPPLTDEQQAVREAAAADRYLAVFDELMSREKFATIPDEAARTARFIVFGLEN